MPAAAVVGQLYRYAQRALRCAAGKPQENLARRIYSNFVPTSEFQSQTTVTCPCIDSETPLVCNACLHRISAQTGTYRIAKTLVQLDEDRRPLFLRGTCHRQLREFAKVV